MADFSAAEIEAGRLLFAGAWDFISAAGGLGSLPCAMLTPAALRDQFAKMRARTDKPVNVNFFCHKPPALNNAREARWRDRLASYYRELGIHSLLIVPLRDAF